ncbi:Alpha/beta hydrolase-3 [Quillaja saponaria]|uniref:Alpha/beta hydrolase-3 n=1 Tax=Quillaja saponaria TaxID=32244 RepID=A0AAD7VH37_QUISA|nr:Alpha/beta hydrolase-3 [Quillaja saponaria]
MEKFKSSGMQMPTIPWKTRLSIFYLSTIIKASRRSDCTVNRRLFNFLDIKSGPNPSPINGIKSTDIIVDPNRKLWFRLYIPTATTSTSLPVVIYFHGGGFAFLSPASFAYDAVCRRFASELPAIVVSVNYRLGPEHRYPSQFDDGFDVLKFLDENHDVLPQIADVSKCFLSGDSAGGNIIHHLAVRVYREGFRVVKIIGLLSIQPFFGGEERTESEIRLDGVPFVSLYHTDWFWKVFLPDGSDRDHQAVNITGPNAIDISGLDYPDTLIFVSGFDPMQEWQRRYYEWLRKSGKEAQLIEYPNAIHGFYLFPELPDSSQFISHVKEFVAKTCPT